MSVVVTLKVIREGRYWVGVPDGYPGSCMGHSMMELMQEAQAILPPPGPGHTEHAGGRGVRAGLGHLPGVPLLAAGCLPAITWTASVLAAARRERGSANTS